MRILKHKLLTAWKKHAKEDINTVHRKSYLFAETGKHEKNTCAETESLRKFQDKNFKHGVRKPKRPEWRFFVILCSEV